ncbi:hypothetical protein GCM10010442_60920 [Kitasatospora kifunensis]|uniref:Uncharacterized protein n=1 Tax=Kitasatospora kifunensis TaxID=58351 RepID=A0A7W7VYB6_KITKI|nr:hypothetical protein [Kitasatospora kifunensis]
MPAYPASPTTVYRPQVGQLVADLAHHGRQGIYMDTLGGRAYLRPNGGGCEWDTDPDRLEPVPEATGLAPVSQRRNATRCAADVQLPEAPESAA